MTGNPWNTLVKHLVDNTGLSHNSANRIINSMRKSTKSQYTTYITQFCQFANRPLRDCTHIDLIEFIESLFTKNKIGYSTCNVARSAISTFFDIYKGEQIGKHPLVCRFMKGIYEEKPNIPKYATTWDPKIVLDEIEKINTDTASIIELSRKIVTLLTLLSGQRVATIASLTLEDIKTDDQLGMMYIFISKIIKQSRPRTHQQPLTLSRYENKELCVVYTMNKYIEKTQPMRGNIKSLWLTTTSPTKEAKKDTVSNWIRSILQRAGLSQYGPHSLRSSGTSKAATMLPIDSILKAGGWTKESTFARFYQKPIHTYEGLDKAILKNKVE